MWTIGRSQRVEEKKYRPIVRKIRGISNYQYNWVLTISAYLEKKLFKYCQITEDNILSFQFKKTIVEV